jgi:chemotaxis protein MotA
MDIATILGLALSSVLVFLGITFNINTFSISFANLGYFIDPPSIMIVVGGTFASTLASFPLGRVLGLGRVIVRAFRRTPEELIETLTLIIDVSKIARKNILAIEDALPSIDNLYLRNGLRLVVDRVDRELIIDILQSEMRYLDMRRDEDITLLKTAGSFAPAFGMIGTLIGLVILLQNLTDPSSIGPAMAVAIITTFYGSMMANTALLPWANKLTAQKSQDRVLREMVRDGVLFIEKGERPEFIEQDLMNYLPPEMKQMYEEMKFESARGEA